MPCVGLQVSCMIMAQTSLQDPVVQWFGLHPANPKACLVYQQQCIFLWLICWDWKRKHKPMWLWVTCTQATSYAKMCFNLRQWKTGSSTEEVPKNFNNWATEWPLTHFILECRGTKRKIQISPAQQQETGGKAYNIVITGKSSYQQHVKGSSFKTVLL